MLVSIFQVFRWMQKQKWYKSDGGFYPKLIVVMGKANQLRMAVWLFRESKRNGHRPDTSLYNALITAHLHSRDKGRGFQKALQLLEDMKQRARYVCFCWVAVFLFVGIAHNIRSCDLLHPLIERIVSSIDRIVYESIDLLDRQASSYFDQNLHKLDCFRNF